MKMVGGVVMPYTPEEEAQADLDAQKVQVKPLYVRVSEAFGNLDLDLQIKFKDEIRDSAFFFLNNNLPMLAVVMGQAESKIELPADQAVKDIVDLAKQELGLG
jgi:hypothetical protein